MFLIKNKKLNLEPSKISIIKFAKVVRIPDWGEHSRRDFSRLKSGAEELARRRNQIFSSLLLTYEKIMKLGLIYINKKMYFNGEEVTSNV